MLLLGVSTVAWVKVVHAGNLYASKAQLRTLQRRVKVWRVEWAKEMVMGRLRKSIALPAEI